MSDEEDYDEVESGGEEEEEEEDVEEEEEDNEEEEEGDNEEEEEEEDNNEDEEEEEEETAEDEEEETNEEEEEETEETEEVEEEEEEENESEEEEEEEVVGSEEEEEEDDEEYDSEEYSYHNEQAYSSYEQTHSSSSWISSTSWAQSHGYSNGQMPYTGHVITESVGSGGYNKNQNSFGIAQGLPPKWVALAQAHFLGPATGKKPGKQQGRVPTNVQKFGPGMQYRPSDLSGKKKALLIGINYFGTDSELNGCINDVHNMGQFLVERYGFNQQDFVVLTDDQQSPAGIPTRDNILKAMQWLVDGAQPGDNLFIAYSGHGGSEEDEDGDEDDGMDETMCPVDYQENGQIHDDQIHDVLVKPLPAGCRLTALFDCCHSGSILDLPYLYSATGVVQEPNFMKGAGADLVKLGKQLQKGNQDENVTAELLAKIQDASGKGNAVKASKTAAADVICFTGCRDDQTSADANIDDVHQGALTYSFKAALLKNPNLTYLELLNEIRRECKEGGFEQVSQLSSCHPVDVNIQFTL